jgi:anti-anti-sigma factor
MWGITGRGARLGDGRRTGRTLQAGTTRIAVRGPVEHAVLELSGELDFAHARDVTDVVAELPHRIVSIDLAGLEFLDGAGARAIEFLRDERARLHGERPALIGVTRPIERTLCLVRSRESRLAMR